MRQLREAIATAGQAMSVSETLLSMVAFRLAVLVLLAAVAPALSARSYRHDPGPRMPVAAPLASVCASVTDRGPEDALIREMVTHD